ncbi:MAG: tyrosine--tRNA ligase, partial [Treponema sp.]|nr:tyrosine--tRNA ligase [Treponema sp.]
AFDGEKAAFSGQGDKNNMPTVEMPKSAVESGTGIIDLFFNAKLGGTKSDIRRLIEQGGASINGKAVTDVKMTLSKDDLDKDGELVLKSGKKKFVRVVFK